MKIFEQKINLYPFSFEKGNMNMTIDEALFNLVINAKIPIFFRLYSWSSPTVSLGKNQTINDIDIELCNRYGIDIVRRMTGGRAVLHFNELTYSIGFKVDCDTIKNRKRIFTEISKIIQIGLEALGYNTIISGKQKGSTGNPDCFKSTSLYEITNLESQKVVGSAMSIKQNCVFQHGAIPFTNDYTKIAFILSKKTKEKYKDLNFIINNKMIKKNAELFLSAISKKINFEKIGQPTILDIEISKLKDKYLSIKK